MKELLYNKTFYNKDCSNIFIFSVIGIISAVASSVFMAHYTIMLLFILIQDFIIVYYLLTNRFEIGFMYYIIFLATSFETSAYFADTGIIFYGFKSISIFGISNNLWMIVVVFLFMLIDPRYYRKRLFGADLAGKIMTAFVWLVILSVFLGIIRLFIGDHGLNIHVSGTISAYLGEAYYGVYTLVLLFIGYQVVTLNQSNVELGKKTIIAILITECIAPYIAYVFGCRGGYGGDLLFQFSKFLIPFLLLVPLYYKSKYSWLWYLAWGLGNIVSILFFHAGTGKELLFLLLSIALYVLIVFYRTSRSMPLTVTMVAILGIIGLVAMFILSKQPTQLGDKMNQLFSMIAIWKEDWLETMPTSPKFRIYEIMSIFREISTNPISFLFGKGYAGGFIDYFGYFSSIPVESQAGGFSAFEWQTGVYFRVHETFARLLLCNGILGLALIMVVVVYCIKHFNVWSIIGCTWFIFYYNTTVTLSVVGILALCVALADESKASNCLQEGVK